MKVLETIVAQCLGCSKAIFKNIFYKNSTLDHSQMDAKTRNFQL
jgi:hypothetical protein